MPFAAILGPAGVIKLLREMASSSHNKLKDL